MGTFLRPHDRRELLVELKIERSRKYADRIRVILLLDDGETYHNISKFLFLDEGSIANYRKRYKDGGLEELINDFYSGKMALLSEKQKKILTADLQLKIFPTSKAVIIHIKVKFGVLYSRGGVTELLHRLGFSFKKATAIPGKANREEQKKFLQQYKGVRAHGPVYFADATHPEFAPTITYGWIKKGEEFDVKTNSGWRKRVNVCGAVEINSLDIIARSFDTINYKSICQIMKIIRNKNPNDKNIYLVLDGAGYNKSK